VKEIVGDVELWNRSTGQFEPARVVREIDADNFDCFTEHWQPTLSGRREEFSDQVAAGAANVQDWHWKWVEKAIHARKTMAQETFAVECDGHTQGLMLVDMNKYARLPPHKGREIVLVDLLATAPWNRHKTVEKPKYKGVGQILIGTAIGLSLDSGFEGRIGLDSLPQSESWYRDHGFTDVEFDYAKKMRYFEMTAAQAAAFIAS